MSKQSFPWLALGIGLFVVMILIVSGAADPDKEPVLPLLTLLILAEFGFILNVIGAFLGFRTVREQGLTLPLIIASLSCAALAIAFAILGVALWPEAAPGP